MATTTPNFGWAVPTSTDLVKDGAVAIETLGDAIDASLVDLKGGTTGQVLAKASNTDMDFVWSADAAGISPTIFAAKGDLLGASANDTPAVLTVGANGETLVADSSQATGLRYQVPVNANPVINSAMQVWQRGTSIACTTTSYTADRWQGYRAVAGATVSRQVTGDTTNLPFIQYCARVQRDSGNTSTSAIYYSQSFESINSIPYAGKTVTLSFYARSGANFTNPLVTRVFTGTGTDQNILASYTGAVNPIAQNTTLTTTWQRFSYTATLATTATELALRFDYEPTGTAGAADFYEVTGVQLEVGSVATPFKTYAGTIQGELAACQRYFWRITSGSGNNYQKFSLGHFQTTTTFNFILPLRTSMRTTPSISTSGSFTTHQGTSQKGTAAPTLQGDGSGSEVINFNATVASATEGYAGYIRAENSTSTFIDISAEL